MIHKGVVHRLTTHITLQTASEVESEEEPKTEKETQKNFITLPVLHTCG